MCFPSKSGRVGPAVAIVAAAAVLSLAMGWSSPVSAQGFFQQLLGLSTAPAPQQARGTPPPARATNSIVIKPQRLYPASHSDRPQATRAVAAEGSGSYTTVCVRMCDGFHFPISHRVPRSRFYRDADACNARCGETEARLFFHPSGGDMKSAVDLTGRSYARLPIAFLHRKRLVAGCTCRPEPWSEAAAIRHEGYAIAEGRSTGGGGRGLGAITVVAGRYSDVPALVANRGGDDSSAADDRAPPTEGPSQDADVTAATVASPQTVRPDQSPAAVTSARSRVASASARRTTAPRPQRQKSQSSAKPAMAAAQLPRKPTRVASIAPVGGGQRMVWPGDGPVRTR